MAVKGGKVQGMLPASIDNGRIVPNLFLTSKLS